MTVTRVVVRQVPSLTEQLHPHPLLAQIYAARGVRSSKELDPSLQQLFSYDGLKGIAAAVELLVQALREEWSILVVGDFDTDGATSTALVVIALRLLGHQRVTYLIPSRFGFGYGLSREVVASIQDPSPQLIITVDNGITSVDGVAAAIEQGIKVLITDHHLAGAELPLANAIVNPNQGGDNFASKALAGVGVAFYLMLAYRAHLREIGWFKQQGINEPNLAQLLDLVALGTVADMVPLDQNNRRLVAQGLKRIREGRSRPGILALLAVARRDYQKVSENDLGFAIAPRLNAAGRLDDMSLGVEALLTEDPQEARQLAHQLTKLNDERREIEESMQRQAAQILDNLILDQALPAGVCLLDKNWHQGVLGILASRLKDQLGRPVIAFANVDERELKGSARSIPALHLRDILGQIAQDYPGLISKFGGHAMAAGLSLPRENYEKFSSIFARTVEQKLTTKDLQKLIYVDGELSPEYFNLETVELLRSAGPWGVDFGEPLFWGEFTVGRQVIVGKKHLRLGLHHPNWSQELEAIYFNPDRQRWPTKHHAKVRVVYRVGANEYNGSRTFQLIIVEVVDYE